jgi:non-canonical purine NTP pyrophosphatase (RdgB/HAM1 family)
MNVTFITGNQDKADFLAKHMNRPIAHRKVDLDEIQSLELREIADHKARQAYQIVGSPVLVEDVGLAFDALERLPGPFIKWFLGLGLEKICKIVDGLESRSATAKVCFAYFDGKIITFFNGEVAGSIADSPRGDVGFGFDPIFIPKGSAKTYGEMNNEEVEQFGLRTTTVFPEIKRFLQSLDKA